MIFLHEQIYKRSDTLVTYTKVQLFNANFLQQLYLL